MTITAPPSVTSMSTEGFRWCFEYTPRPALFRRTCQVAIKATAKTKKPRRITAAAIAPPFQWKAVLAAEPVGVGDVDVEVAVWEVVEAAVVDSELDAVDKVVVVVVAFPTSSRSIVNGSFARTNTIHIAKRHCSRASDGIQRRCQAFEMMY